MINKIRGDNSVTQENSLPILKAFSTHFLNAFQTIDVHEDCMNNMLQCNIRPIPPEINSTLIEPITKDEIRKALSQGKPQKAPGTDGIEQNTNEDYSQLDETNTTGHNTPSTKLRQSGDFRLRRCCINLRRYRSFGDKT